jgi:hypothetical protein
MQSILHDPPEVWLNHSRRLFNLPRAKSSNFARQITIRAKAR